MHINKNTWNLDLYLTLTFLCRYVHILVFSNTPSYILPQDLHPRIQQYKYESMV